MNKYQPKKIEKKWQKFWREEKVFATSDSGDRPKYYVLDMFPYPSGAGLHVGHPKGYIATDVVARMKMMQGFNVLHPMGWDAFGLPAENFALKNKIHPSVATKRNIATFKKQLGLLGFTYDWTREINTTDPAYYRWTQWTFLQMFKRGLAYESNEPVNWCPSCKTVLANEDLENGRCERCGSQVEQRPLRQWVLKITDYAERLLKDLDKLGEWPESIKTMQREWIGKSEGAEVKFNVILSEAKDLSNRSGGDSSVLPQNDNLLEVFTTRPDTLFGVTYCVIAPEHELVDKLKNEIKNWPEVEKYVEAAKHKTALERTELQKEKSGVELKGVRAVNPASGEELPIFVADYVLANYGTGAIMAVPAHDERDWEFAKKYGLPIKPVVLPLGGSTTAGNTGEQIIQEEIVKIMNEKTFCDNGYNFNSGFLNGLKTTEAKEKIIAWLEEKGLGKGKTQYKLRDWVFSRQRYWGEPIPLVYCENCAHQKPKVLLIHGLYGHSKENWFPWFKKQMENRGYDVLIPDLPNAERPTLKGWLSALTKLPIKKDDKLFVVGHSLGGPAACQFVLQHGGQVEKLILIAPTGKSQNETNWKNLLNAGCDEPSLESIRQFNAANVNLDKIKNYAAEAAIYLSDNDPYIPLSVEKDYQDVGAQVRIFKNKGHFNDNGGVKEFPEIFDEFPKHFNLGWVPVPENDLPVELPKVKNYEPSGTGESPLATIDKWVNTKCPRCGGPARRETNTMPQWAGSCWYYLRYIDPKNSKALVDKAKEKYWSPVDFYVGGAEHATRHLIYARFWHKFLFDIGAVNYDEPFTRLKNVGLILAEDGRKMSKRWNNVINPDDIVKEYGADALRVYEMFMGPFDQSCAWNTQGLVGMRRFLEKVWRAQAECVRDELAEHFFDRDDVLAKINKLIVKVTEDIKEIKFNTAIAKMIEFVNGIEHEIVSKSTWSIFLKLLSPFAPHICDELWCTWPFNNDKSIIFEEWPVADPKWLQDKTFVLAIQVNGKLRATQVVGVNTAEEAIKKNAIEDDRVQKWLEGKPPKKVIYVKGKLVSIVV